MFKIRSDPKLSHPNPIRVVIKNSNPIRSEESFNKINFSFKLKCFNQINIKTRFNILLLSLTLSQQAIFVTTSDIFIELFYNVNISARIHPPLKQRTPLKS